VFRHFCERLTGRENFADLRFIMLMGEPVSKREVELYQKLFPPTCRLINRLGSTETGTIDWYFVDKDTESRAARSGGLCGRRQRGHGSGRGQVAGADRQIGEIAR
jgi:acyl-coenzyme A synthetase/AMP-(fatty) acid ligase